nr:hypothetical protein [Candidatus Sigynarchaeota archaeon]
MRNISTQRLPALNALKVVLRVGASASASFFTGFLIVSPNLLGSGEDYTAIGIALLIGVLIPLFLGILKVDRRVPWVIANFIVGASLLLMINGILYQITTFLVVIAFPSSLVFSFFQTEPGPAYEQRWRCETVALIIAATMMTLGRFLKFVPFVGWNALYACVVLLFASSLVLIGRVPGSSNDLAAPEQDMVQQQENSQPRVNNTAAPVHGTKAIHY